MLEIFQYDFMVRAIMVGVITSLVAPTIGIFLVVKRYSLLSDTLAHVSLLGVVSGLILRVNPLVSALITTLLVASGIEFLRSKKNIYGESILAVVLSGSLATALILLGLSQNISSTLFGYLFGSITTVTTDDVQIIGVVGFFVLCLSLLLFKYFFAVTYDEDVARASRLPVGFFNLLIVLMAAVIVAISMRIVGVLLIGALMVIPVLSATQFKLSFSKTAFLGIFFSLVSSLSGLVLSFYFNLPSGASIVMLALCIFGISLIYNRS